MSGKVRYELAQLWPSEIADQLYCEYKVHLRRTHPEVQLESLALAWGEANHAALAAQAAPITEAEIEKSIREGKKLALCEWTLEGVFRDVPLRGRPDFFAFEGKNAQLLLDFKFSGGDRPYRSQEMQAALYALLAESMGFATAELCYGIVLFPRQGGRGSLGDAVKAKEQRLRTPGRRHPCRPLSDRRPGAAGAAVGPWPASAVEGDGWTLFLYHYDHSAAEKDLNSGAGLLAGACAAAAGEALSAQVCGLCVQRGRSVRIRTRRRRCPVHGPARPGRHDHRFPALKGTPFLCLPCFTVRVRGATGAGRRPRRSGRSLPVGR